MKEVNQFLKEKRSPERANQSLTISELKSERIYETNQREQKRTFSVYDKAYKPKDTGNEVGDNQRKLLKLLSEKDQKIEVLKGDA